MAWQPGVEINKAKGGGKGKLPYPERQRAGCDSTVVFPEGGAGKNRAVLQPLLDILVGNEQKKVGERTLHYRVVSNELHVAWWQEGPHLVLVLGDDDSDSLPRRWRWPTAKSRACKATRFSRTSPASRIMKPTSAAS